MGKSFEGKENSIILYEGVLRTATPGAVSCLGDVTPLEGIRGDIPVDSLSIKYRWLVEKKATLKFIHKQH